MLLKTFSLSGTLVITANIDYRWITGFIAQVV